MNSEIKYTYNEIELAWLTRFRSILLEHLANPLLTNGVLAQLMKVSEREFYRKVNELTNKSPNRYIRQFKLQKAHEFLESGKYRTIKEIVPLVGFVKVKYFYSIFKKEYGYPPGKVFRRKEL